MWSCANSDMEPKPWQPRCGYIHANITKSVLRLQWNHEKPQMSVNMFGGGPMVNVIQDLCPGTPL